MTKKEFNEWCKEIMASAELTQEEKKEKIDLKASIWCGHIMDEAPEMSDLLNRFKAAENKLAGHGGFSYCPESGDWYPHPPPAIKALENEFSDLRDRQIDELCVEAMQNTSAEARA
jgi:hypothetical protein